MNEEDHIAYLILLSLNVCQSPGRLSATLYKAFPALRWMLPLVFLRLTLLESGRSESRRIKWLQSAYLNCTNMMFVFNKLEKEIEAEKLPKI